MADGSLNQLIDRATAYAIDAAAAYLVTQGRSDLVAALRTKFLPMWTPAEQVAADALRVSPIGNTIRRTTSGTTRATYDATESALWVVVAGGGAGGSATTSATDLTSGTLSADRIADGSLPAAKLSGQLADGQIPSSIARDSEILAARLTRNYTGGAWEARGTSSVPLFWISTLDPAAARPTDMIVGDMWIQHPDATTS